MLSSGLWNSQCYVKMNDDPKFTGHGNHSEAKKISQTIPRVRGHFQEWTDAILNGTETFAPFELGGHLTEIGLSGIVALKLQKNMDWNGETMKARDLPEADTLVHKENRTNWL